MKLQGWPNFFFLYMNFFILNFELFLIFFDGEVCFSKWAIKKIKKSQNLVELCGIEPQTSCVQGKRSPSWAIAPNILRFIPLLTLSLVVRSVICDPCKLLHSLWRENLIKEITLRNLFLLIISIKINCSFIPFSSL